MRPWLSALPLALPLPLMVFVGCGTGSSNLDMDQARQPVPLATDANLHLLAAWTEDSVVYAQGESFPTEKQPWPAVYRVPAQGGGKDLLANGVYRLRIQRSGPGKTPLLTYLTAAGPDPQTLRSTGILWVCRPGEFPREITPADPALVLQPALLSPDSKYLLTYGRSIDPLYFHLDLTDLDTGVSRRLASPLAVVPPSWFGFDGPGGRYVGFSNVEDLRPYVVFRLDGGGGTRDPVVLPGRMAGLLPDGRAVVEGDKLLAVALDGSGAITPLADGPIPDYGSFVAAGVPYFVQAQNGQAGPLVRYKDGAAAPIFDGVSSVLTLSLSGRVAYLRGGQLELIAVDLPAAKGQTLSGQALSSYRPLPGDAILWYRPAGEGAWWWAPGRARGTKLAATAGAGLQVSGGRFAIVEAQVSAGAGALHLVSSDGQPVGGTLSDNVDLMDSLEREPDGRVVVFSVPAVPAGSAPAQAPGIYRLALP